MVKDKNGRAYNRTAYLSGRREMMQGWVVYLDQLRLNKVVESITQLLPDSRIREIAVKSRELQYARPIKPLPLTPPSQPHVSRSSRVWVTVDRPPFDKSWSGPVPPMLPFFPSEF